MGLPCLNIKPQKDGQEDRGLCAKVTQPYGAFFPSVEKRLTVWSFQVHHENQQITQVPCPIVYYELINFFNGFCPLAEIFILWLCYSEVNFTFPQPHHPLSFRAFAYMFSLPIIHLVLSVFLNSHYQPLTQMSFLPQSLIFFCHTWIRCVPYISLILSTIAPLST